MFWGLDDSHLQEAGGLDVASAAAAMLSVCRLLSGVRVEEASMKKKKKKEEEEWSSLLHLCCETEGKLGDQLTRFKFKGFIVLCTKLQCRNGNEIILT